ncbi:MAG: DUF488 family protein [Mycobacterium sp.]|nr:DUF488 family protein [Mycobacterium sp.]
MTSRLLASYGPTVLTSTTCRILGGRRSEDNLRTKLAAALHAAGIEYVHHRALGNPKDNRAGFRVGEQSLARYRKVLDTGDASDALDHVCGIPRRRRRRAPVLNLEPGVR